MRRPDGPLYEYDESDRCPCCGRHPAEREYCACCGFHIDPIQKAALERALQELEELKQRIKEGSSD